MVEGTPPAFRGFNILITGEPTETTDGTRSLFEWHYELRPTESGDLLIDAFTVTWTDPRDGRRGLARTERTRVRVHPSASEDDLRPAKPPLEVPAPPVPWGLAAIGGGGLAVLLMALLAGRRKPLAPPAEVKPAEPAPLAQALEALARLAGEGLIEQDRVDAYHVRLSAIVRRFLSAQCGLAAEESTTTEIAARLEDAGLAPDLVQLGRAVLYGCDLEKFAAWRPSRDDMEQLLAQARRLVTRLAAGGGEGG
jgi:hypothetical protein